MDIDDIGNIELALDELRELLKLSINTNPTLISKSDTTFNAKLSAIIDNLMRLQKEWADDFYTSIGDTKPVSWFGDVYTLLTYDDCESFKNDYVAWDTISWADDIKSDYHGGFAIMENGDIVELWLYFGIIPELSKICERVI